MDARILAWGLLFAMTSPSTGSSFDKVILRQAQDAQSRHIGIRIEAAPAPEYDALFQRSNGWIGADGDYSVTVDKNTVLWLYSDTFVGTVKDNRRVDTVMINNSVGVQRVGSKRPVEFFYRTDKDGKPGAFITPDDGRGYFWLFDGAMTSKGLFLFLTRVEHSDRSAVFPFKLFGMSLGHVTNPTDPPLKWHIEQRNVPFSRFTTSGATFFGSATLKAGPYIYIYGVDSFAKDAAGNRLHAMIVARVAEDKLGDFAAWRFFSRGKWVIGFEHCDPLFSVAPTEYSVSYVPGIRQYAAVYTEGGIYGKIMVRLSQKPQGPWGPPVKVYDCPDRDSHEKTYSYAAKAHPELSDSLNELIVTYATNSMHFPDVFDDARLYWPRFVKLTFEKEVTSYE